MTKKNGRHLRTVSISADLERRMKRAGDQVNWSAVAAQAFERKLGEIAAKKEAKSMQDVIQRLRGLKAEEQSKAFLEGKGAGEGWAKNFASPAEMQRLEDAMVPLFGALAAADHWRHDAVFQVIRLDGDSPMLDSARFWDEQDIRHDQRQNEDFLRGWVDGVLGLWDAVKAEVNT